MQDVGKILRETRESQGYDIADAAAYLKVRPEYLEILESGDISSVSNEIYILGYLKSYATWLGLNSCEVTQQFKTSGGKLSVAKNAAPDSSVFINIEERILFLNKPIYLFCAAMLCVLYFVNVEYNSEDVLKAVDFDMYSFNEHRYSGFSIKKADEKKIMLLAKADLGLKLNYSDSFVESKYLRAGEVFFVPSNKDVLISSNRAAEIDVYSDDESGEYLGTLKEFYIYN